MSLLPQLKLSSIQSHHSSLSHRILHALTTCTSPSDLLALRALIFRHNLHFNTTIASEFFAACSSLNTLSPALSLFSALPRPHVFVCNSLLRALAPLNNPLLNLRVFSRMHAVSVLPNRYTFPHLLKPISALRLLPFGRMLHSQAIRSGLALHCYTANSFLNLYSACADIQSADRLFDEMLIRDVIAWSTIIAAHSNSRRHMDALIMLERMQFAGVAPNRVTMINSLTACAASGALETGVWIHDYIGRSGWVLDVVLGTSLIDMYGKCGRMEDGLGVFLSMPEKNVYTWNSIIGGFALAKSGMEAVRWFSRMEHEGIKPDRITVIEVLCACKHSRMVETAQRIFHSVLNKKYGFYPCIKHYGCMVDILGRAGRIDAALEWIERMPYEPNAYMWGSLLAGCRARGNLVVSEVAVKKLMELEPENVGHYVVLSNLYAEMGRWIDAEVIRRAVKQMGLRKDLGWSLADNSMIAVSTG